jgi:hypothetical protein
MDAASHDDALRSLQVAQILETTRRAITVVDRPGLEQISCECYRAIRKNYQRVFARGVKPRKNRRVLNGIFWVLCTGAPWRDLPKQYGPYTTAYTASTAGEKPASGIA